MSSLKEKAKTGQEIYESIAEHYYHSDMERKELWVRLEDAEQEIERIHREYESLISKAEKDCADCYQKLKNCYQQLKQKLRHCKKR
jgi:seryl-tRNA synthetase